jgi:hypothetical protein
MNIEKIQTETYQLTDLDNLDPITVYTTNYKVGQGKMVIECFCEAWAAYFGRMGECDIQEFILGAHNDYLLGKLLKETSQTDFDEINEIAHKRGFDDICVTSDVEIAMQHTEMAKCFGPDWYMDLPRCKTPEYNYVSRILNAVKAAFSEEKAQGHVGSEV